MSRSDLEKWLQRLRPDLNQSQALAQFEITSAQLTSAHPISQTSNAEMPTAVIEEGGGEWFYAMGEIELPTEDVRDEKVHTGVAEVLSEGDIGDIKEGPEKVAKMEVEKPERRAREEEVVQQSQTEEVEVNTTE